MKYFAVLFIITLSAAAYADEKHQDDPTKIITKLGIGYSDDMTLSGSIGLDETKMINASINVDSDEWRIGGSWLFQFGIVNFNFGKTDFSNGATKESYSVGTFIPLKLFGFAPYGWQIFPMAGINYSNGKYPVQIQEITLTQDYTLESRTTKGIYLGAFALRPLNSPWTIIAVVGGSKGSNDYSGYWAGVGMGFRINANQSAKLLAYTSDDDYGNQNKLSFSYTYEFK